jgi:excisionase family DNA binding protein
MSVPVDQEKPFPSDPIKPSQAAKLLGIHPSQVYRYMHAGRLAWWELPGGHRRLSRAEVLALPKQGQPKPKQRGQEQGEVAEVSALVLTRQVETARTLREFGVA